MAKLQQICFDGSCSDVQNLEAGEGISITNGVISADGLATVDDLAAVASQKQDLLTAGANITIDEDNVISATGGGGGSYTAGDNIVISGNVISAPDVATDAELAAAIAAAAATKQDTLTAGQNITIDENNVISASGGSAYTAGDNITIANNVISAPDVATTTQLATKQNKLTAGTNISISGNTISATDTKYTAGTGLTLSGTQFSAKIANNGTTTTAGYSADARQLNPNVSGSYAAGVKSRLDSIGTIEDSGQLLFSVNYDVITNIGSITIPSAGKWIVIGYCSWGPGGIGPRRIELSTDPNFDATGSFSRRATHVSATNTTNNVMMQNTKIFSVSSANTPIYLYGEPIFGSGSSMIDAYTNIRAIKVSA